MDRNLRADKAWPLLAVLAGLLLAAGPAMAQRTEAPRWSVAFDVGAVMPSWLYNEWVTVRRDTSFRTAYRERIRTAPVLRGMVRFRPRSELGAFFSAEYTTAGTDARYTGGDAEQRIDRHVTISSFAAGVTVRFSDWANGGGGLEYLLAPVLTHHKLDLSNGHRDAFAREFGVPDSVPLRWSGRSWTSWGLVIGLGARFPVGQDLGIRVGVQNLVVPVQIAHLAEQDEADVSRLAGRHAQFSYRAFTSHYPSIRIGLDYVISRVAPRPEPVVALPPPARAAEPSAETRAAQAIAARGDTVGAIDMLRQRVRAAPDDASAWRALALLLAAGAENDPAVRAEAWDALQRAVVLNPDDEAVLVAYGRVRALLQRARAAVPEQARPVFTVSPVSVQADAAGGLSIALSASGLPAGDDGRVRYRIGVEVIDDLGEPVPVRLADAPAGEEVSVLEIEREGDAATVSERLELRMARARPGAHTLRVRVTSPSSGQAVVRVAGFQIR